MPKGVNTNKKKKKINLADRVHPLYEENKKKWELYKEAIKGGEDFINTDNLFTHRLEDPDDFDERLNRAYYLNFCETIPGIYNNYIFKEKVERPLDTNLESFRSNMNGRGMSISDFVGRLGYLSKIFGAMHCLVDMPEKQEGIAFTKRYVTENNINPFCKVIYPYQLRDWAIDSNGNFEWIIIEEEYYRDADPTVERQAENSYMLITKSEWRYEDSSGKPFKFESGKKSSGDNKLGFVPLITLYHKDIDDDRIGESMLKDIVYINRAIFNWCSCIDEMIERQTFSQLIIPDDGTLADASEQGDDPLRKLGTAHAWTFNANAVNPPAFITPNTKNIITVWKLVVDHIKEIYRIAGLVGTSEDLTSSRSGRAAQMGFLGVNSALAETARRYQQFENDISRLALIQLGKKPEDFKDVKYPDSFDLQTLSEEVSSFFLVMEKNFSETLNKEMMKNLSRRALPMAAPVIREKIEKEIEDGDGYVEPQNSRQVIMGTEEIHKDLAIDNGEGNPNLNQAGDTFRTKDRQMTEESQHRTQPEK